MKNKALQLPLLALALLTLAGLACTPAQACKTCAKHNTSTQTPKPGGAHGHEHLDEDEGFTTLLDANHTDGWSFDKDLVKIEDGAIVMGMMDKPIPHHSYAVYKKPFYNFELRLQVKIVGPAKSNGGIQFRSENRPDKNDMSGYQADAGFKYWGRLYDQSRRGSLLGKHEKDFNVAKDVKQGDWNDYVLRAEGGHIRIWINGKLATDYTEKNEKFAKATGVIGLQVHTGPPSVRYYRNIRIKELD